jgi:hypothetical protein
MHRTSNTFSVLQAIAATVALALILWAMGVPSFRIAEAAALTDISNTLSDSAPGAASDHTIEFVSPNAIGGVVSQGIVITFETGSFDLSTIGEEDIDLLENGVAESIGGDWTVSTTSDSISILSNGLSGITAGATTTVLIGLHATNDGSPDSQIINPTAGSYTIDIDTQAGADSGQTQVAIVDSVQVTASVDTQFTFTVAGVLAGEPVNTADTTGGSTTANTIEFGLLEAGAPNASTAAQDLTVNTNATNGFVVTVTTDQQLQSTSGADIDGFRNGTFDDTPQAWESPTAVFGSENTYGHWGITTDDPTIGVGLTDDFDAGGSGGLFVSASTTPVEVFRHNGPADGTTTGQGTTRVGYKVEISALQEAGTDYTATLTYVATPVF